MRNKASTASGHGILRIASRIPRSSRIHLIWSLLRGSISDRISRLHTRVVIGRRVPDLCTIIVPGGRITVSCRYIRISLCIEIARISRLIGSLLGMISGNTGNITCVLRGHRLGIAGRITLHAVLLSEICSRIAALGIISLLGISCHILGIVSILIHSDSLSASYRVCVDQLKHIANQLIILSFNVYIVNRFLRVDAFLENMV